jgi:two-component system NtrC family sensor kinase
MIARGAAMRGKLLHDGAYPNDALADVLAGHRERLRGLLADDVLALHLAALEADLRALPRGERGGAVVRSRSLGTLAAGTAHEINNPLTFVVANLGFAIRELQGAAAPGGAPCEVVEALAEAQEGAERIRLIVHDLRAFSRLEDSAGDGVDVNRVLSSCLNLVGSEVRRRAQLVRELADLPPVRGTDGRLGQVFLNLVLNAAQAIPEGDPPAQTVRVASFVDAGGYVVVEVHDTGVGIAPDVRSRIFDPFFSTKPPHEGSGLGLSICRRIIKGMGGDITAESVPGRGSTFRVRLPPRA